jgi:hypothetical protein
MSTEAKHTPGPWTYKIMPIKPYHRVPEISICNADGHEFIRQSYDTYSDQAMLSEFDACLIAAAPEMLEALEKLTYAMLQAMIEENWGKGMYDGVLRGGAFRTAKSAIAKAKGVRDE